MPAQPWRAGARSRPGGRWRPSLAVALMAALGGLALAKLGLLVEGMLDPAPPGLAPAFQDIFPIAAPMPAAGPEAPAPDPAAPEVPAPAAPEFDPRLLTAGEIAVLQQLAGRRTELDQRAQELDRRQAVLETAAAALQGQIARLSELRDQIAGAIEQHDAAEEAKLKSLVKIYEAMKAKAAAEIFDRLEMPVLIRVVERMREPKSADVLARMDPAKARQVTTELARRTKLLGPPPPASAAAGPPPEGS